MEACSSAASQRLADGSCGCAGDHAGACDLGHVARQYRAAVDGRGACGDRHREGLIASAPWRSWRRYGLIWLSAYIAEVQAGHVVWLIGLVISVRLAVLPADVVEYPDGLEWVAEQQGFIGLAQSPLYRIIPDYAFPGISGGALATIVAGLLGTACGVRRGVGLRRSRRETQQPPKPMHADFHLLGPVSDRARLRA